MSDGEDFEGGGEEDGFMASTSLSSSRDWANDSQDRGLSEIGTVADRHYENVYDRIREAIPGKERMGRRRNRKGQPIEDETGTGQPHVKWNSDRSSNKSREPSGDEQSDDDRRTTARSVKNSRRRSFDDPRPRRERVIDWEADNPPSRGIRPASTWSPSGAVARIPYRNSYQPPAPYSPANTAMVPYGRGPPPPYPYPYPPAYLVPYNAAPPDFQRYRSRSMTPPGRKGHKSKKEKIKETVKPIAAGGAGLVAGAFIGHAAGKGDLAATAIGAALGAIGGFEAEEYLERKGEKKEKRKKGKETEWY